MKQQKKAPSHHRLQQHYKQRIKNDLQYDIRTSSQKISQKLLFNASAKFKLVELTLYAKKKEIDQPRLLEMFRFQCYLRSNLTTRN